MISKLVSLSVLGLALSLCSAALAAPDDAGVMLEKKPHVALRPTVHKRPPAGLHVTPTLTHRPVGVLLPHRVVPGHAPRPHVEGASVARAVEPRSREPRLEVRAPRPERAERGLRAAPKAGS